MLKKSMDDKLFNHPCLHVIRVVQLFFLCLEADAKTAADKMEDKEVVSERPPSAPSCESTQGEKNTEPADNFDFNQFFNVDGLPGFTTVSVDRSSEVSFMPI